MAGPRIYSREYYERLAAVEDNHWWSVGMRAVASALVPSLPTRQRPVFCLDAGCGTGAGLAWAETQLGARTVVGVDVARPALELARQRTRARLVQASILALPFRPDVFDFVSCHDVLQHLPIDGGDSRALAEAHRVLRPGGVLLARANSRLGMHRDQAAVGGDFRRFDLAELVARIRMTGFIVERATYANLLPAAYASLRGWIRGRSGARDHTADNGLPLRAPASRSRVWLDAVLRTLLAGEARYLSGPGRRLPFGHTTFCVGVKPAASSSSRGTA